MIDVARYSTMANARRGSTTAWVQDELGFWNRAYKEPLPRGLEVAYGEEDVYVEDPYGELDIKSRRADW